MILLALLLGCSSQDDELVPPPTPELVDIAGATFTMGHADVAFGNYGQEWKENELPPHEVTVSAYSIMATEVTVADWAAFLDALSSNRAAESSLERHFHPLQTVEWTGEGFAAPDQEAERPARFVSWYDATTYCSWLGMRLPTEAEWELAAKGSDDPERRYPWGDDNATCAVAVYFTGTSPCEGRPDTVGARSPGGDSPHGVRDMAGNVGEWVADRYGAYGSDAQTDPTGPSEGDLRVVRGGGYRDGQDSIRVTSRFSARPQDRSEGVGMRCAVSP